MKNGRKFEDLIGRRYGRLTVIGAYGKVKGERKWFCRCDCGTERIVYGKSLKSGITLSCGCFNRDNARKLGLAAVEDLTDRRFGRLVVRVRSGSRNGKALWTCKCDCGNEIIVLSSSLKNERTKSCGCLRKERAYRLSESNSAHLEVGQKFGRLIVVGKEYSLFADGTRRGLWTCKCDCGKIVHIGSKRLTSGSTNSCGCLRSERQREIVKSQRWIEIHTGKRHSLETKKKMRLLAIERISIQKFNGMPMFPCIGREEKRCLDELSKVSPYPLQRQYRVDGYFLDGYVEELKLAIEFDEGRHRRPEVEARDKNRQIEIENSLGCRVFRITSSEWKEKTHVIDEFRKIVDLQILEVGLNMDKRIAV